MLLTAPKIKLKKILVKANIQNVGKMAVFISVDLHSFMQERCLLILNFKLVKSKIMSFRFFDD